MKTLAGKSLINPLSRFTSPVQLQPIIAPISRAATTLGAVLMIAAAWLVPALADNALEILVDHTKGTTQLVPCLYDIEGPSRYGYFFCRMNTSISIVTTPSKQYPKPMEIRCKPADVTVYSNFGVRQCRPISFKDPDGVQGTCDMVNLKPDGSFERCIVNVRR